MVFKYLKKIINRIYFTVITQKKINKINKKIASNNKINIIPIIIDCEVSTLNQYLEPVVEELLKLTDYNFEFYFGETFKGAGSSYSVYKKENVFPVNLYQYLKGDILFISPHIYPKGPESAIKIIIDHGICSAKFSFHPKEYYLKYDIYFVTGKLNEEKIKKILQYHNLKDIVKIINIGYPKSDNLYNGNIPARIEIFNKLNLAPNKKTILYAPSWEEGLSAREFGIQMTEIILNNKEINFIVKLHPCFFVQNTDDSYNGGKNWEQLYSPYFTLNNFTFIKEYKSDELLYISDIMITDLSSIALEFLALEKPVIYLDCPKFEKTFNNLYKQYNNTSYSDLLNDPLCNAGRHVGLINYDYNNILNDIEYIIKNPEYKLKERKDFSENILSNKGTASKACVNSIIDNYKYHYNIKG